MVLAESLPIDCNKCNSHCKLRFQAIIAPIAYAEVEPPTWLMRTYPSGLSNAWADGPARLTQSTQIMHGPTF
jgi:hypothetical protein